MLAKIRPPQPRFAATIANELPYAKVISTDLSPDMVEMARRNAAFEDIPNLEAAAADMQNLSPLFQDGEFDVVTCCYGYMFPPNKQQALNETFRVLKPGTGIFVAIIVITYRYSTCQKN